MNRPQPRRRTLALVLGGLFVVQLGWLLAIPAFGGIDEIDHAYRAGSVARGHWVNDGATGPDGRGELVAVPADLVVAAYEKCDALLYMRPDNCRPVSRTGDGQVLVASAAARYNPVYYALTGTPARLLEGAAALYAQRLVTLLIADVFLLAALWACLGAAGTLWPVATLLTAATPTVLYAMTVAAPNGIQLAAALSLWTSGLILCRRRDSGSPRAHLWIVAISAATVITVHTTGPLWVALTGGVLLTLAGGWSRVRDLWSTDRRHLLAAAGLVGCTAALAVAWTVLARANFDTGEDGNFGTMPLVKLPLWSALWVFQAIGTIPFRNDPVHTGTLAVAVTLLVLLVALGFARGTRRDRAAMVVLAAVSATVPVVLTAVAYDAIGPAWQGRYVLPFAFGLPLLVGWVLDDRGPHTKPLRALAPASVLAFGGIQATAFLSVLSDQQSTWPDAHTLPAPPASALLAAALLGTALLVTGLRGTGLLAPGSQRGRGEVTAPVTAPVTAREPAPVLDRTGR